MKKSSNWVRWAVTSLALFAAVMIGHAAEKKIVLIAGPPSHGAREHEHRAGCLLLQKCLNQVPGIHAEVCSNGWPAEITIFRDAAAVVVYSDGGDGHPFLQDDRLKIIGDLMKKGTGLGCIHYAVEVPKNRGGAEFLDWIGGYYETFWSVNPTWLAHFKELPQHPITRGVTPFNITDEWYYHMRFRDGMDRVTPILTAVPPAETHQGRDDAHGGNPYVRARVGKPEHMMWAAERANDGRGFGFTGGHFHRNWGNENFRKVVLNAILWIAHADVPADGVACTVTAEDLKQNLDPK